jgi:hypothetical protein
MSVQHVLRHYWNLVITLSNVNLGDSSATIQAGVGILDVRNRVAVDHWLKRHLVRMTSYHVETWPGAV